MQLFPLVKIGLSCHPLNHMIEKKIGEYTGHRLGMVSKLYGQESEMEPDLI